MTKSIKPMPSLVGLLLLATGTVRAQPVTGDVTTSGFRAPTSAGFVARAGQWIPIMAELQVHGSEHFQGELRVECPDLDGDRVAYTERPVALTAGQGLKRVWCYVVVNRSDDALAAGTLDVIAGDGAVVNRLPLRQFDLLPNDTHLILDISERPITKLADGLGGERYLQGEDSAGLQPFYRPIMLGKMPARELPDRWFGLEAVNVIVWDEPDPGALSIAQLDALIAWVRNGGQLIVGIGASWGRIRESRLAEIMPIAGEDPTVTVRTLELFFQNYVAGSEPREFKGPVAVTAAKAVRGIQVVNDLWPDRRTLNLVVMDSVGAGRITTVAASLRDLTSVTLTKDDGPRGLSAAYRFFKRLFDLSEFSKEFRDAQIESAMMSLDNTHRVYADVIGPIEFKATGGLLFFIALIFVVAYILVATLASWLWLQKKSATHLSWTLFAAFAVVGSVLSVAAVAVTRGFPRVHAVSFINLEAGSREGRATCYFGYRSPFREVVDLTLPGERNYLRPLTPAQREFATYATPERYRAVAGGALLEGALMRSTLKQFEGHWEGDVGGTVRAQLEVQRDGDDLLLTPESWIKNDLPVKLTDGYLLFLDPRLPDAPDRAAWQKTHHFRRKGVLPPALGVIAIRLPPLEPGAQARDLGRPSQEDVARRLREWRPGDDPENPREPRPDLPNLLDVQSYCVKSPSPLALNVLKGRLIGEVEDAALLASTRNLHLPCYSSNALDRLGVRVSTSGMVDVDISHWLVYGQAVLLLFADDGGPAQLHRDGVAQKPRSGESMYRVRVPIKMP